MSRDWFSDIDEMHTKYGFHTWVKEKLEEGDTESLRKYIHFRLKFIREELNETFDADYEKDPEELVDGLIDICVVAIGTLNLYGIDAHKAWDEINNCNMNKERGVKPNRPNPLKLPDLMKPEGWVGPDHSENHGHLIEIYNE